MNNLTLLARQFGQCPDRFWYQLNDQSAQDNYNEQLGNRQEQSDDKERYTLIVESKVNTK